MTVKVPGVTLLLGRKLSPVPAPVPATKLGLKLEVWSVFEESRTVHVVPFCGFVISVPPFAVAWKKTALPPGVTLWLFGVTVTEVTPWRATVTVVDPEHAEQLPELPVIVALPTDTPVTTPELCPTETELVLLEDHVTPEVRFF